MDSLLQDVRFAIRSLLKAPGFTAVAVLCMALGIAANVFVYSPVNAILIRPLPYPEADRLMHLNTWRTDRPKENWSSFSWADYTDVRAGVRDAFTDVGAYRGSAWNVGGIAAPERVQGSRVSASLFPLIGLRPALGRFFSDDEERAGRTVVLGHGLWQRKFAGDSGVIGRGITLNGVPYTVIGVMAEGIRFPEIDDIWLPAEPSEEQRTDRDWSSWQVIGRLRDGVTREAAEQRLQTVMRDLATRFPDTNRNRSAWMLPSNEDVANEVGAVFLTMVGAVAFVLLIACSNVANLLLARGSGRQRELAVRLSMGATRTRLVRQMLTESMLLAIVGGVVGVGVAVWSVDAFVQWGMPTEIPFYMRFDVDKTVLLMTAAVTLASGVLFGIVPALRLTRPELATTLKEAGGRGGSANVALGRLRAGLVVSQLVLSVVLLAGAALMVQSFLRTQRARLGFDSDRLLTGALALAGDRYASDSLRNTARANIMAALRAVPGVQSVAMSGWLPIGECCSSDTYRLPGRSDAPADRPQAIFNVVSPGYFAAMGAPLLRGREFSTIDRAGSARVAVISQSLARREWGERDPVGQLLYVGSDTVPRTVVGVVGDFVVRSVGERRRQEHLWIPLDQSGWASAALAIRTAGDPSLVASAVRTAVTRVDPDLPIARLMTMDRVIRDRMFQGRVFGTMFAIFGLAALALASIGLYGVMSYSVAQRTQEMGVRIALGAQSQQVVKLVLGSGVRMVGIGIAIGVPAAIGLAQLLRSQLYGISTTDPLTFGVVPLVLVGVALVASLIPARRATRVDPLIAMRSE